MNINIITPSTVSPFSPWENCWQLRECFKDHSKRMMLARQLERQILLLAVINFLLAPLIQAWQILYFFFNYAEVNCFYAMRLFCFLLFYIYMCICFFLQVSEAFANNGNIKLTFRYISLSWNI